MMESLFNAFLAAVLAVVVGSGLLVLVGSYKTRPDPACREGFYYSKRERACVPGYRPERG